MTHPDACVGLHTCVDWSTARIDGTVYIGAGVRIEPGARVFGPTWIGHGCHIRTGSAVERSVLFEYTRIGAGQNVSERIMSHQYCVDRYGDALYVGDEDAPIIWGDARA